MSSLIEWENLCGLRLSNNLNLETASPVIHFNDGILWHIYVVTEHSFKLMSEAILARQPYFQR
jgi:hypothetical protein